MTGPKGVSFCLVFGVEVLANGSDLTKLNLVNRRPRERSAARKRAEHQLKNGLFAEAVGTDLQPAVFDK